MLTQQDIETCLRVLARASEADPDDPRWEAVRQAAGQIHRANKKARKAARRAGLRRRDQEAVAASERYREQDPGSEPAAGGPAPRAVTASSRGETATSPTVSPATPPTVSPTVSPVTVPRLLARPRRCYVCKTFYRQVHPDYHLLCSDCSEENLVRRHARCDLRGRRAIVTGGRVKIGFHVALKLLRDGAEVLVTTRFPRDAARRFAAVRDSGDWLERLHVHGVDLLDLPAVAGLLDSVHRRFPHLDILVNNAAQTIRRPPAYHREVRAAENDPLTGEAAGVDVADAGGEAAPVLPSVVPALSPGSPGASSRPAATDGRAPAGGGTAVREPDLEALFPAGRTDETGQPLDLREHNSWSLRLHEVDPVEWLEVQTINAFAPFLLTSRLRGLLEASPFPDRYVVQVSAMEGSFSRENKTVRHPHTNMAKASLNMLTRTAAADYAASGIHMNSVDTGWVTDERPHPAKTAQREAGFRPPLDVIDGAARVYDPIVRGVGGERMSGLFLKDYRPVEW
ncbi:SDR family oxidoreductase [Planomonospora sp. ID67723]|uniref:SDR family NAD(P)-dependent oxidoreductase n=1 Tax=Planomonospora sp. ID67723 TaxID=2738134 RepID=UPI0018C40E6F|nr:SDR family NAD(P)-dependent oxidoreductase [Planomonospora sp. ID67723]MBG0828738.1 SDR family oxidoreductase [Planomonospora sp. ID67723]